MIFIPLHSKNTVIVYKSALFSVATIIVFTFITLSVMIPVIMVSLLSPYSGISEAQMAFEKPHLAFKYQSLFMAEKIENSTNSGGRSLVTCSTFPYFNQRTNEFQKDCESTKFWSENSPIDGSIDRAHFQLRLGDIAGKMTSFDLILFFEAKLMQKCLLMPPAILTHRLVFPQHDGFSGGSITLTGHLKLVQHSEFICPFYGRNIITKFRKNFLHTTTTGPMTKFQLQSIRREINMNPAYFQLEITETYFERTKNLGTKIILDLKVSPVGVRYHLNIWERLGQFWLYFASFFGVSFYVMNKMKDYLFSSHIIRSWEIIPWKKFY